MSRSPDFIRRMRRDEAGPRRARDFVDASTVTAKPPLRPFPPVRVRERFSVLPRLEALAVVKGERLCTNGGPVSEVDSIVWPQSRLRHREGGQHIGRQRPAGYAVLRIDPAVIADGHVDPS